MPTWAARRIREEFPLTPAGVWRNVLIPQSGITRPDARGTTVSEWLIIIEGIRFDYLLQSVYATSRREAVRLARREVLPGEKWHLTLKG